uniref:Uncharacterized protein n=1 Tax=Neobodo designis TaxID=312471 RepID=A0A7S1QLH8_NEODS|mmetsp:Transcript_4813/g.15240  ORF Transcript_4813/g.15240 Transcript_4813/m.15240 type:complete len:184 (+) Transcript_4813:45-596(+)
MLRKSNVALSKPRSYQTRRTLHPMANHPRWGHDRTVAKQFAWRGWGVGGNQPERDRRWPTPSYAEEAPFQKPKNMPMSNTTKTLSGEWRPYALSDGGVLFTHPTRDQVMQWNYEATMKENEAAGSTARDHNVKAKMQALIADNTLEHTTLADWRRQQLQRLIQKHAQLPKASAKPLTPRKYKS